MINQTKFWTKAKKPEYLVILTFAMMLIIYGTFNVLPLFGVGLSIDPQWGMNIQATAGIAYVTSGIVTSLGFVLKNRSTILQGSLAMFCCFIFASILRILTYGLEPLGWLIFLFIAIAVGICRYYIEVNNS